MSHPGLPRWLLLIVATALLSGCGAAAQSGAPDTPPTVAAKNAPDHADLLNKVYDTSYSTPDGFHVDERAETEETYTVHHVKDISVSYEVCTDDFHEALAWEAADNESRVVNGHFVDSTENPWYFEFTRELTYPNDVGNVQGETTLGFSRIFKCATISRNGVDRNLRDGFGGTLNARPVTAATVKDLTEYLWQFEYFESSARKVIESMSTETDDDIRQTLRLAFLYPQGYGTCDRIEVVDWTFSADKHSGEITRQFQFRFAIEAQHDSGKPVECVT